MFVTSDERGGGAPLAAEVGSETRNEASPNKEEKEGSGKRKENLCSDLKVMSSLSPKLSLCWPLFFSKQNQTNQHIA